MTFIYSKLFWTLSVVEAMKPFNFGYADWLWLRSIVASIHDFGPDSAGAYDSLMYTHVSPFISTDFNVQ